MKIIDNKCKNCGGSLSYDLDNMVYKCENCGSTFPIDISEVKKLMIEKEKTKRMEMKIKNDKEETDKQVKESNKDLKLVFILIIAFAIFSCLFFYFLIKIVPKIS